MNITTWPQRRAVIVMRVMRHIRHELRNESGTTSFHSASPSYWLDELQEYTVITRQDMQKALTWGVRRGLLESEKQHGGLRTYGLPHKERYV